MRTVLFVALLVAAVLIGLYIKKQSSKGDTSSEYKAASFPTLWDTLLPGRWKIYTTYTNSHEKWHIDSDADFLDDHSLKLNSDEQYFDFVDYSRSTPVQQLGGGVQGIWRPINDSAFFVQAEKCDFKISKEGRYGHDKKIILSCDNFSKGIRFGSIEDLHEKTYVTIRNRDTLEINGKSYSGGYDIYTMFVRVK